MRNRRMEGDIATQNEEEIQMYFIANFKITLTLLNFSEFRKTSEEGSLGK